ncbi:MAG: YdcF family protein [Rickettsiales bacterium]|jgi:uncharacterized SAM-binding protein YcdF (DUF218 family)|nr:YdcF family protein [Rickettsiales bacterium]
MILSGLRILFSPYALPAVIFAAGFLAFKAAVPECGAIAPDAQMFVLTGDARRIPFALKMLDDYPKRKLFVIGAGTPAIETPHQNRIEIENKSKSTYENAIAIKHIARKKLLTSIVVITTSDHINRAMYLARRQMPIMSITACPVPLSGMPAAKRLDRWLTEYVKFIGTMLGINSKA